MSDGMWHTGGTTKVVGVTLQGPTPLGTIHIPWTAGLNVLYGANGAGKTSILRAIDGAFSGYRQPGEGTVALIHLSTAGWWDDSFTDSPTDDYWPGDPTPWIRDYLEGLNDATLLQDRASDEPRFQNEELADLLDNATTGGLLAKAAFFGAVDALSTNVLTGLLEQPHITMAAVGSDGPRWILYSSAPPRGEDAVVDRYVSLAQQLSRIWSAVPPDRREWFLESLGESFGDGSPESVEFKDAWEKIEPGLRRSMTRALRDLDWANPERPDQYSWLRGGARTSDLAGTTELPLPFVLWGDFHETPDWVPTPFLDLGAFEMEDRGMHLIASDAIVDIDQHTRQWINRERLGAVDRWAATDVGVGVEEHAEEIMAYANDFVDDVIPTMPVVAWSVPTVGDLRNGRLIAWKGIDPSSAKEIPIGELSAAQQRWLRLAIAVGITRLNAVGDESALLIDEPELALHRRATRQVASSLGKYAKRHELPILVASHSAEFLAEASANLYHVSRHVPGDGRTSVVPIERESLVSAADLLDLEPGELLQMVRSFVLVEGEHDIAVLEEIVGGELHDTGAELVPMRGADNLDSLLESNLLFTYTSAQVVVVLDGIPQVACLREAWDEARGLARGGTVDLAKRRLNEYRSSLGRRFKEQDQLINFAIRSLDTGFYDRIELYGFARRDIIEYLEPSTFGLDQTWDELSAEYRSYRDVNTRPLSYKQWLGTRKKALFNTETIRASASLRGVQDTDEFAQLVDRLEPTRRTK